MHTRLYGQALLSPSVLAVAGLDSQSPQSVFASETPTRAEADAFTSLHHLLVLLWWREASQAKQSPGTLCHMSSKAQTTLLSVPWGLASAWLSSLALGLGGLQVDYGVILFWFCSNPVLLFCVFMSLRMSPARETHSQEVSLDICCFRKVCLSLLIFCCGSQCDSG